MPKGRSRRSKLRKLRHSGISRRIGRLWSRLRYDRDTGGPIGASAHATGAGTLRNQGRRDEIPESLRGHPGPAVRGGGGPAENWLCVAQTSERELDLTGTSDAPAARCRGASTGSRASRPVQTLAGMLRDCAAPDRPSERSPPLITRPSHRGGGRGGTDRANGSRRSRPLPTGHPVPVPVRRPGRRGIG